MDFRRSAARRRRVMRDDVLDIERSAGNTPAEVSPFQRYNTKEVLRLQPMMLDWLPKRTWTNLIVGLGLLLVAAFVVAVDFQPATNVASDTSTESPAVTQAGWQKLLSLSDTSSLGHLFWTASGLGSVVLVYQLFLLRRHREDDYLGSYQVWLWTLPLAAAVAFGSVPSFRNLFDLVFASFLSGQQASIATGTLCVLGAAWIVAMSCRLFFEVRESIFSAICLCVSAIAGVSGLLMYAAIELQIPLGPMKSWPAQVPMALQFAATVGWQVSLLSYLGFVCRDVIGLISHQPEEDQQDTAKSKTQKTKKSAAKKTESSQSVTQDTEADHESSETDAESLDEESATTSTAKRRRRGRRQAA